MVRDLGAEELRALWTLTAEELRRAGGKRDANALAFAVLLKFFQVHGRFPRGRAEVPDEVVRFVAGRWMWPRLIWGFTSGPVAPLSGTARRFVTCWGSGNVRWLTTRRRLIGWCSTSPRSNGRSSRSGRSCWGGRHRDERGRPG